MSKLLLRLGCWLLVVVMPLNAFAADAVGMLTTVGTVLVDHRATTSTAVFAGAVVETKANSKAFMSSKGTAISLAENSTMRLGTDVLELQAGAVVVSSSHSLVRIGQITITASSNTATKFLARRLNDEVQVVALEGTVDVNDGQQTTTVPATRGAKFPRVGKPSWLLNDDIGILIVVAAAVAAGVTLGVVNAANAKAVSPAVP